MSEKTEQDYLWDSLDEIFNTTIDIYPSKFDDTSLEAELRDKETNMVVEALEACDYNQTHTASLLKVGRTNLIARCKRLGISLKSPEKCFVEEKEA